MVVGMPYLDLDIDLDAFMLGSFLVKTKALVAMPDARPELPLTGTEVILNDLKTVYNTNLLYN